MKQTLYKEVSAKQHDIRLLSYEQVRTALLQRREIALIDVREEAIFAQAHPLFAANLPFSRLEVEVFARIPNRHTTLVVYDNGENLALKVATLLVQFGYTNVHLLQGGLDGWRVAEGEIFQDVNSASKAFGELVESKKHTPSLSATDVKKLLDENADVVILDARRYEEYNTMSIPSGVSVPGAELVLRVKELAAALETLVIVNCAGRTRSIIGTQSLINAGIANPVFALRNGTIGWTLAGQVLEHGQTRSVENIGNENYRQAIASSLAVADRAGVKRSNLNLMQTLLAVKGRTNYKFDVRTPDEYLAGHLPGFLSAPGGQLVQETDHFAPVRGARIFLADDKSVRANMTASWLAQMGWEVYVLDGIVAEDCIEKGSAIPQYPDLPSSAERQFISPLLLKTLLQDENAPIVIDLAQSADYFKGRIPGASFVLRSRFTESIKTLPKAKHYILTSKDGLLAAYALPEFEKLTTAKVLVLKDGTSEWISAGYPTDKGGLNSHFASPQIDRYRRPYEGAGNSVESMQAYLDWEYGLVGQLERDGTHGFFVI